MSARIAVRATFGIALVFASRAAHADPATPHVRARFESGYAVGIDVNRGIHKSDWRTGIDYRWSPAFSTGAELAIVHFLGVRDGRTVDTLGVTLLPIVRWSFLRHRAFACSFDVGLGLGIFTDAFPPGGTPWNGYSTFGIALEHALDDRVVVLGGLRLLHHSNGRGIVEENPAFDGAAVHVGIGVRAGR